MPNPADAPVLYDTVTLHLFAEQTRLDLLQAQYGHRPEPVWCAKVKSEVEKGLNHANARRRSRAILDHPYLGHSSAPEASDVGRVLRIVVALGDDPDKNEGEAQSIVLADERGGSFATDDRNAHDFAVKQLGSDRVLDACAILANAVAAQDITSAESDAFHRGVPDDQTMRCKCTFS